MVFRRVTHRSELAKYTASAAKEWAEAAAAGVAPLLRPYLRPGETLPDVALLQQLVGRLLEDRGAVLTDRGDAQVHSEHVARQRRWDRDAAADSLRQALRSARFYFDNVRGRGYGARLGIGHGLSRMQPAFLARLGEEIARHLAFEGAGPQDRDPSLPDPAGLTILVDERAAALEAALRALYPQNAGNARARGEKRRSLAQTEKIVRNAAAFLGGLYKLSDLHDLAARVRPVFRRPRRRKKAEIVAPMAQEAILTAPPPDFPIALENDASREGLPERPEFIRLGVRGVRPTGDDDLFPEPPQRKVQAIAVVRRKAPAGRESDSG